MQGHPRPESCVGLVITLCTEWILKRHTKNTFFAHQSQKSESYTARLPFGSTKKVKLRQKQLHIKYTGRSSSRKLRRVIYYTLYRMDPQKTH